MGRLVFFFLKLLDLTHLCGSDKIHFISNKGFLHLHIEPFLWRKFTHYRSGGLLIQVWLEQFEGLEKHVRCCRYFFISDAPNSHPKCKYKVLNESMLWSTLYFLNAVTLIRLILISKCLEHKFMTLHSLAQIDGLFKMHIQAHCWAITHLRVQTRGLHRAIKGRSFWSFFCMFKKFPWEDVMQSFEHGNETSQGDTSKQNINHPLHIFCKYK